MKSFHHKKNWAILFFEPDFTWPLLQRQTLNNLDTDFGYELHDKVTRGIP